MLNSAGPAHARMVRKLGRAVFNLIKDVNRCAGILLKYVIEDFDEIRLGRTGPFNLHGFRARPI